MRRFITLLAMVAAMMVSCNKPEPDTTDDEPIYEEKPEPEVPVGSEDDGVSNFSGLLQCVRSSQKQLPKFHYILSQASVVYSVFA